MPPRPHPSSPFRASLVVLAALAGLLVAAAPRLSGQGGPAAWKVVAWNNLGMHCMDADFSVFAILPPYNTIQAQVIDPTRSAGHQPGRLAVDLPGRRRSDRLDQHDVRMARRTSGRSSSRCSASALPADVGLAESQHARRGQHAAADDLRRGAQLVHRRGHPDHAVRRRRRQEPLPDDEGDGDRPHRRGRWRPTNIVLPVSDEMDCTRVPRVGLRSPAAQPAAGWVNRADPQRDYRLNILRLHDDQQLGTAAYASALAAKGYSSAGLVRDRRRAASRSSARPATCPRRWPGSGIVGIPPLTASIHRYARDGRSIRRAASRSTRARNRSACYRCHPGSVTRCLRGAMGNAVAADGTMAIQCQNCHGSMSVVGVADRTGWLQEPTCQQLPHRHGACRTAAQIRYTSALRSRRPAARGGRPDVCDRRQHAGAGAEPLPVLERPWRPAVLGVPRLDARRVPVGAPERQPPEPRRCRDTSARSPSARRATRRSPTTISGGPHGMHPVGAGVGVEPPRRRRQPGPVSGLPRAGLPGHRALARLRRAHADDVVRRQDAVSRLAGRLLHVPQRPVAAKTRNPNRPPVASRRVGIDRGWRAGRRRH